MRVPSSLCTRHDIVCIHTAVLLLKQHDFNTKNAQTKAEFMRNRIPKSVLHFPEVDSLPGNRLATANEMSPKDVLRVLSTIYCPCRNTQRNYGYHRSSRMLFVCTLAPQKEHTGKHVALPATCVSITEENVFVKLQIIYCYFYNQLLNI